jgi:hypothetical protein
MTTTMPSTPTLANESAVATLIEEYPPKHSRIGGPCYLPGGATQGTLGGWGARRTVRVM